MKVLLGVAVVALTAGRSFAADAGPAPAAAAAVTFARDIAPLLMAHCVGCHRPGGAAPFSLLTYQEVRSRARPIAAAVAQRKMPPWKPVAGYGTFAGARRLSDAQIALIEQWLADDCPPGDLSQAPALPARIDDWRLGTPDLVLRVAPSYRLPPGGNDRMRSFVVRIPEGAERYVRGWELRTDNHRVVHHATMVVDGTTASRRLDDADPAPGFEGLIPLSAQNPDGFFLGWTPGQTPYLSPDWLAWRLPSGADLVVMLHLKPTAEWEPVGATLALYFAEAAPARQPAMIRLNRQDLDIPPGERRYTAADSYVLPVPVTVYGVQPHAHNLAREVKASATLPDGTVRPLLYISDWDFHWQDAYRYEQPIEMPAGTRLQMEYVYDNSGANPANPNFPPKRVTYGQRTSDEMGDVWIQVMPRQPSDLPLLSASLRRELLPKNIAGYRMMSANHPEDVDLHNELALLYIEAGEPQRAAAEFRESLQRAPATAAAHYNLANAELMSDRVIEAEAGFRAALQLNPDYGLARQGLGLALRARGQLDEAATQLQAAVGLLRSAEAHYNLGAVRQQQRRLPEALSEYREAVRLDPQFAGARAALAGLEAATSGTPHSPR